MFIVDWKPIMYWFFGPKKQSFRNKSGKTQPIRTKFGVRGQVKLVQRILGAISPFWPKWGLGRVPRSSSFFCLVNHATFRELRNGRFHHIWLRNVVRCSVAESGKIFSKIFTLGVICPQNLTSKLGQTGTLLIGHKMHCREILFTPHCSSRAREFPRSVSFLVRRTVAKLQLRSVIVAHFRTLAYFPHTKPLKRTFQWPACSPGLTSQNDYDFSIW